MLKCSRKTSGGKGNEGMFIERDPKICAAGKPTTQAGETVGDQLQYYLLQDKVDALIHDAIKPESKTYMPTKPPKHRDMRNAGIWTDGRDIINPPRITKFKQLVNDLKETSYSSYWKKQLGTVADEKPFLPTGLDPQTTTFGKKTKFSENLYDLIMPKVPIPDVSPTKRAAYQIDRNYCTPPFNPNLSFGINLNLDKSGKYVKCCLTDDRVSLGTANYCHMLATEADFKRSHSAELGMAKAPNNNISSVPPGFAFGILKPPDNLPECLMSCEFNVGRQLFLKCLAHLNAVRKCLSKREDRRFFRDIYMHLKYLDKNKTGWLSKEVIYNLCSVKHVRCHPSLMELLLEMWNAFDGSQIKYKTFVDIINYREPLPTLPKINDVSVECMDFSTTYKDMVKPGQVQDDRLRAGTATGKYFEKDNPQISDGCCKADLVYLPDESDAYSCLCPSNLTLVGVSHRDMFAKRSPEVVRRVFEASGEPFTDKKFNEIWDKAKQYHSQGWVSYATFRKALQNDT